MCLTRVPWLTLAFLVACSHRVALFCDGDTPCTDPARPFCDLQRESPASEGIGKSGNPHPVPHAPVAFDAVETRVAELAIGGSSTCAITTAGNARCWGSGFGGKLGYANTSDIGDDEQPFTAGDIPLAV